MDSPLYASLLDMGLLGIVALAFAEKLIPVLPSYLMLVFLGATYVSGVPELIVLVLATVCGSTLGALFWYGIGRLAGKERTDALVARFGAIFSCRSPGTAPWPTPTRQTSSGLRSSPRPFRPSGYSWQCQLVSCD